MTFLGDGSSNMAHSYLLGGATAGLHVRIASPGAYRPDPAVLAAAAEIGTETGGSVRWYDDPAQACAGVDVLATDVWTSMGQEAEQAERTAVLTPYALDKAKLDLAAPDCIVLHCLPAHRGQEISAEVLDGPHSRVWDQAENRLHAQKALLTWLLAHPEIGAVTVTRPGTKASRQAWVAATLADRPVRSQEELARLLAERGMPVTQATLSRDLEEIGAVRVRSADGSLVYALPEEPGGPGSRPGGVAGGGAGGGSEPAASRPQLSRTASELLISAEASANMVVLRTPAGAAQFLASVLDHAAWPSILGTVAGDDTVLVIARDPAGGDALAAQLLALAERLAPR